MEDLISELPDVLLQLILSNVSTRDSVRTSVLSTRWRHIWQRVPGLHLRGDKYTNLDMKTFIDRFLEESSRAIHQFTLVCNDKKHDIVWLELLLYKVITRGVQCFAIDHSMYKKRRLFKLPTSFFKCETLVHLTLDHVNLGVDDCELFNLPRLETLYLSSVWVLSEMYLEILISSSPVLRVLSIRDITLQSLIVRSQTLKRFNIKIFRRKFAFDGVLIDTPSLEFLTIQGVPLNDFRLERVSSSIKLCIACDTLFGHVTNFPIPSKTLKVIYRPYFGFNLPIFQNLNHLNACLRSDFLEMLLPYLSSCPNLKSLDLGIHGYPNVKHFSSSSIPPCFQTTLEFVEINMSIKSGQMVLFAKYILENATKLKKLTLWVDGEADEYSISGLHRMFPNRSLVDVKIGQVLPTKFRRDVVFEFKPFFDPKAI